MITAGPIPTLGTLLLRAGVVFAVASNLDLFAACRLAVIATVLLTLANTAPARLVRAYLGFFVSHDDSPPSLGWRELAPGGLMDRAGLRLSRDDAHVPSQKQGGRASTELGPGKLRVS